jgi:steroid delta-isomerase-like uncharacterized protein
MSNEISKKVIMDYYQFFNEGDMPKMLALLHDDVIHDINHGERQIGKPLFDNFMARMNQCYQENVHDIQIMMNDNGTQAGVEFTVDGKYLKTDSGLPEARGQTYTLRCGAFFEIKHAKIMRITNYYNLNDWIRQVSK